MNLMLGGATGTAADSKQELRMDYAVLDLGPEKLVARYVGPAESMAFAEGALRESLMSLQGRRLAAGDPVPVDRMEWSAARTPAGQRVVPAPAGWVVEPGRPRSCPGLPRPSRVIASSLAQDFSVVRRAAECSAADLDPETAAKACSTERGSLGGPSYASRDTWLGVSYLVEGVFVRLGPQQVVQLEVISPETRGAFARALLALWARKAAE